MNTPNENTSRRLTLKQGFTLIELLVVVGIIAILLAVALPIVMRVQLAAENAACTSNTRQLLQATLQYANDYNQAWVAWYEDDDGNQIDRKELLHPYLGAGESNVDVDGPQAWHCPSNEEPELSAGYGFNTNLNWMRIPRIARPNETVGITDAGVDDNGDPVLATHVFPPSASYFPGIGRPNPRHGPEDNPRVTVAFVGGGVEAVNMELPFYPTSPGDWGSGITDPQDPGYADEMWRAR